MVKIVRAGRRVIVEYRSEEKARKFFELLAPLIFDGFVPDEIDGKPFSIEDIQEEPDGAERGNSLLRVTRYHYEEERK